MAVSLIAPGFSFIFYFFNGLLTSLDILKLIVLSVAFITPLLLINFMVIATSFEAFFKNDKNNMFMSLSIASLISAIIFYAGLFLSYLSKLSLHSTISWMIGFELIFIIFMIFALIGNHIKKPVSPKSSEEGEIKTK